LTHEIVLAPAARRQIQTRHPWIYRDLIASGEAPAGALVRVVDSNRRPLGIAAWSPISRIALRFLSLDPKAEDPSSESLRENFRLAVRRRRPLEELTDAIRLVSSEADRLPGLIVDRYAQVVVVQALTPFAELLLPELLEWILELEGVEAVVARNDSSVRELEGLPREVRFLSGRRSGEVIVREGGLRLSVDPFEGQKTGLFLDQRANRLELRRLVEPGERVLDAFSYTGGFALQAALAGAEVVAVDDSARAVAQISKNAELNGLASVQARKDNAFKLLRAQLEAGEQYDVVVLDPPAFAKNRRDREGALRGYREINVRALRLLRPGGLLVTASCSYHVDEQSFEQMLRRAAADARRDPVLIGRGGQDLDHPVLLSLPESRYLKCLFLRVP